MNQEKLTKDQWPSFIGPMREISVLLRSSTLPEVGTDVYFEYIHQDQIIAKETSGSLLGDVLDENSFLHIRHLLEIGQLYLARVQGASQDLHRAVVTISLPKVTPTTNTVQIVVPKKVRSSIEQSLRVPGEYRGHELAHWLNERFLFRDQFLIVSQNQNQEDQYWLLGPHARLKLTIHENAFLSVTDVKKTSGEDRHRLERASLIHCLGGADWLFSETADVQMVRGTASLLQAITAREEYFQVWNRYRELQKEIIEKRANELPALKYERIKLLPEVTRFSLVRGCDTSKWRDYQGTLSVELVLGPSHRLSTAPDRFPEQTHQLGTVRRVGSDFLDVDRPDDEFGLPPRGELRVEVTPIYWTKSRQK